jgi:hypothetical protein
MTGTWTVCQSFVLLVPRGPIIKVSDLRAPLAEVPESHRPAVEFSNGGRPLSDHQRISSLAYPDVFTNDHDPSVISYALPPGRIFTFSRLGFAIRRYFAKTDILLPAITFLGSSLRVLSANIGIWKLGFRIASLADS